MQDGAARHTKFQLPTIRDIHIYFMKRIVQNNIVKSTCGACVELFFYISRGFSLKRKRMRRTIADGIEFKRNRNNAMYIIELVCTNC